MKQLMCQAQESACVAVSADTFRRVEKKYRLTSEQYQAVMSVVREHMVHDAFFYSQVTSLYYDTPSHEVIERSLEKPLYKEKLRVRMYETPGQKMEGDAWQRPVFVELKKKYKGIGYKRRLSVSAAAAQAFLKGCDYELACTLFPLADEVSAEKSLSAKSRQIAREIQVFRQRHEGLEPSMLISCRRSAWRSPQEDVRVTFDENIQASCPQDDPFALALSCHEGAILLPHTVLMEIKNGAGLPLWLVNVLSENKIYPQSFSKYGTAYVKECLAAQHGVK